MILWLASYPKSGNTWLRLLLTNYLFDNKKDVFQNLDFFTRFPRTSQFKDICKIKEKSLDIENPRDWRGHFLASAFILKARKV